MEGERSAPKTAGDYLETWMKDASDTIARLPAGDQAELRPEHNAILARALAALGDAHGAELVKRPPQTDLYRTAIGDAGVTLSGHGAELKPEAAQALRTGLTARAEAAGLDAETVGKRLMRGAANAREERDWIKADVHAVAATRGLDMADQDQREEAAGVVDRFYEAARDLIAEVRGVKVETAADRLRGTLTSMAEIEVRHGRVPFDSAASAKALSEDMRKRYGETIVKDLAAGKTAALDVDFADPAMRQKIATAVVAAAVEQEDIGLSRSEARAAQDRLRAEPGPERTRDREMDREL